MTARIISFRTLQLFLLFTITVVDPLESTLVAALRQVVPLHHELLCQLDRSSSGDTGKHSMTLVLALRPSYELDGPR